MIKQPSKKQRIMEYIRKNISVTPTEIAEQFEIKYSYARDIVKTVRREGKSQND